MAVPASALTKSGTINCTGGGALVAVYGKHQRPIDVLKLSVSGVVLFNQKGVYEKTAVSNLTGKRSWSAESISLLLNDSRGKCMPPA